MKNFHGKDLASADWLLTHFRAKSDKRISQIAQLPIIPGDRILDICCGPGIYSKFFLDMAGDNGEIYCIDNDPNNIDQVELILSRYGFNNWTTRCADMSAALPIVKDYDVIVIFNSLCYLDKPIEFVKSVCSNAKRGARIILKDFDSEYVKFNGIDSMRWNKLIELARTRGQKNNPLPYNNFFGREIHNFKNNVECYRHNNFIWTQNLNFPFSESARKYIWEVVRSLLDQAEQPSGGTEYMYYLSLFNEQTGYFYESKSSFMIENEFLSILMV